MRTLRQTEISRDLVNNKLLITREFDAPVKQIWRAWTESELLDKWWAPKPWKARTRNMDFREGGSWFYCMEGPDGSQQWCRADFSAIRPEQTFSADDSFCDEYGNFNSDLPAMHWKNKFVKSKAGTSVEIEISFKAATDLDKIIEMGFKEGFTAALENLDELLEK